MKYPAYSLALIVLIGATSAAFGQGKGVDAQNQRITDTGNSRAAGNNGTKQDTGTTGSGITWGKDKTRTTNLSLDKSPPIRPSCCRILIA